MQNESKQRNNEGVKLLMNRDFQQAEFSFQEAVQLNRANNTAWNNLGMTYQAMKEFEKAIFAYHQAIEVQNTAVYQTNLANTHMMLSQFDQAEKHYKLALELERNHESALVGLVHLFLKNNRQQEALHVLSVLASTSNKSLYLIEMIKVFLSRKEYSQIIEIAAAIEDESKEKWYYLGIADMYLKNYGLAESAFKRALAIAPDDTGIRYMLANNFMAQSQLELGLVELNKIIQLDDKHIAAITDKAVIFFYMQKNEEALIFIERALEINPKYEKAVFYKKEFSKMMQGEKEPLEASLNNH